MKDIAIFNRQDFYFNNSFLSAKNGHVGSGEGFKTFSILPSRELVTEKLIGFHGEKLMQARFNPRTFSVPIYFEDMTTYNLRDIALWLGVMAPTKFYWKDDSVYINAMLDGNGNDINDFYYNGGLIDLKFIANDPFYYEITPTNSTRPLVTGENTVAITNLGNYLSHPMLKIYGAGTITVKSYDSNNVEISNCTITGVAGNVVLDTLQKRVYTGSTNLINNMTGTYPTLQTGNVSLKIGGTVTSVEVTPRFRWI